MFQFDFTLEKFQQIIYNPNDAEWFSALYTILPEYQINSQLRVAAFLAQTGVESNNYKWLVEDLTYTADQLLSVFPYYFKTQEKANAYALQPEKIANLVYSNRLGNGPESSGDGWKYRGRGIIQTTGKYNYSHCSIEIYNDNRLIDNPDILKSVDGAIRSACWFWNSKSLNEFADQGDINGITYLVNGGYTAAQERTDKYDLAMSVLN